MPVMCAKVRVGLILIPNTQYHRFLKKKNRYSLQEITAVLIPFGTAQVTGHLNIEGCFSAEKPTFFHLCNVLLHFSRRNYQSPVTYIVLVIKSLDKITTMSWMMMSQISVSSKISVDIVLVSDQFEKLVSMT